MSKPTNKGAIRKTIHRTTSEIPLKSTESRVKILRHSAPSVEQRNSNSTTTRNVMIKNKYHIPELNTSIDLHKKIEKVQSMQSIKIRPKSLPELTPRTKSILSLEKTKKLNFPPDKSVYKNLIPININDSVLMISNDEDDDDIDHNHFAKCLKKKYIPKSNKDPIPELSDFLEPIQLLKHKLQPYEKNEILRKPNNNNYPLIYKLCTEYHPCY